MINLVILSRSERDKAYEKEKALVQWVALMHSAQNELCQN